MTKSSLCRVFGRGIVCGCGAALLVACTGTDAGIRGVMVTGGTASVTGEAAGGGAGPAAGGAVVTSGGAIGAGGLGVNGTATGGAGIVTCSYPSCIAAQYADCIPAGACVEQQSTTGGSTATNRCYANGIDVQITDVPTKGVWLTRAMKNGGTCTAYESASSTVDNSSSLNILGLGAFFAGGPIVATAKIDTTGATATVTCAGEASVVMPLSCVLLTRNSPGCAAGTCSL